MEMKYQSQFEKWYLSLDEDYTEKDLSLSSARNSYFFTHVRVLYEQFCKIKDLEFSLSLYKQTTKIPFGWKITFDNGELRIDSPDDRHLGYNRIDGAPDIYFPNLIYDFCRDLVNANKEEEFLTMPNLHPQKELPLQEWEEYCKEETIRITSVPMKTAMHYPDLWETRRKNE